MTGLLGLAVVFMAADNYLFTGEGSTGASAAAASPAVNAAQNGTPTEQRRTPLPNSVAVLPFTNLSPNADDAYFAAGIHEEILNYLAKLRSLNVIARTSMIRYAGTDKSIPEIGAELNVEAVMEGSVRYADGRVRVTTQLIDSGTGAHIWSDAYERDFKDVFAIQADIAMNVANALNAAFSVDEQRSIEAVPNVSAETYATYLRVLATMGGSGNQGPQMLALLDQMIESDPNFAPPHGLKAWVYANLMINTTVGTAGDTAEVERNARASAERALMLAPDNPQANVALANMDVLKWRWTEAAQRYARQADGIPWTTSYRHWFASWQGRSAEAIERARRDTELDPLDAAAHWMLGIVLTYAGDYDDAVAAFRDAIEIAPTAPLFHTWLAFAEIGRNDFGAAARELELAETVLGNNRAIIYLVDLAYAYGRIGRTEDAQRVFAEIERAAAEQDIGAGGWAFAYLGVGNREKALESLRTGVTLARAKTVDPGFFSLMNARMNVTADPVLEQSEFAAMRGELEGE